jgi:hypothetical protein
MATDDRDTGSAIPIAHGGGDTADPADAPVRSQRPAADALRSAEP